MPLRDLRFKLNAPLDNVKTANSVTPPLRSVCAITFGKRDHLLTTFNKPLRSDFLIVLSTIFYFSLLWT